MAEPDEEREQGLPDWIRDPVAVLRRRWRAMLAVVAAGIVLTAVVVSLRQPVYLAQATVLLAAQKLDEDLVKPSSQGSPVEDIAAFTAEALSAKNLQTVIQDLDLYPELRESKPMLEVVTEMRKAIRIEASEDAVRPPPGPMRVEKSRILSIGFEANDAVTAAEVANRLASLFQTEGVRMRSEQARLATEFMRREVESAENALREQQDKIAKYEQEHPGELPSDLDANRRRIERLQDQRDDLSTSVNEAETRLARLISEQGSTSAASPQSRLEQARAALAKERSVNTDTHPNVVSLKREVAALEAEARRAPRGGAAGSVIEAARREVADYRARLAQTDEELAALDERIARTPSREAEISALQQRAKVLQDSYFEVLRKLKETELAQSLELSQQGAQVAVLHEAQAPTRPENGPLKVAAAGILASFGLAFCLAILLELRDPVIATAQGIEEIAGVPVLGVMPRLS
ncbi:MAG: hypothetical protein DCC71_09300 [Proteobacteria bacterium]|nr:MAG: hypothetical protein DCC71_09300 [Pseudomonadota bacterium]